MSQAPHHRTPSISTVVTAFLRFGLVGAGSFTLILGLTIGLHEGVGIGEEGAFGVGLGAALVLNFWACRHFVFEGAAKGAAGRQFLLFVGSSVGFRGLEYVAFLGLHTVGGIQYILASLTILCTSMLLKFLYYRRVVFPAGPETPPTRRVWFP